MDVAFPEPIDLAEVATGDMPGDSVQIGGTHLAKARALFPALWRLLESRLADGGRVVVAVAGGSGVGKSEIGSLLAHGLKASGIGAYVMSGDNYPRRIPADNDAERLRIYRAGGRAALDAYLGSDAEIAFEEVDAILAAFHAGADALTLKRMGRSAGELWYEAVDVSGVQVIVLEWTHGLSPNLHGVDIGVLLHSTPAETLAHRRARARDGAVDSPFTTMVLQLEQAKLHTAAASASLIVSSGAELLDHTAYQRALGARVAGAGPMLNLYPDSLGGTLADAVAMLSDERVAGAFDSAYLLPSLFNTDLDRGFSVIDYGLNRLYATPADLAALAELGIDLKLDFILNHASVLSPQFTDLLARGAASPYADFFLDWNAFWDGCGEVTAEGYVQPRPELIADMFFRKPGLPILMVRFPDGSEHPYWNTFYQQVRYPSLEAEDVIAATGTQYGVAQVLASRVNEATAAGLRPGSADFAGFEDLRDPVVDLAESRRRYLGQMDLNIKADSVWQFYADTLDKLAGYGARIVRLDAFAYAPKEPGARNFLNDPGTGDLLARVQGLADARGVLLLPEIHSSYAEGIHDRIGELGYLTYDFFTPGLLIDAFETRDASVLKRWIGELVSRGNRTVNMLGCHDGIPVLDLKGLLPDERIASLIDLIVSRGGSVKDLHGARNAYYQVNATYYSALGESDDRLLLARAIQLFLPGKPQVWYLDLFAGRNDHEAVARAGEGGHKEINRTNLDADAIAAGLDRPVVARQLELLRFRNRFPAFGFDATCEVADTADDQLVVTWTGDGASARLEADLAATSFRITATDASGESLTLN